MAKDAKDTELDEVLVRQEFESWKENVVVDMGVSTSLIDRVLREELGCPKRKVKRR